VTTVRPVELAVTKGGAQTVTWLAVVARLFFVPAGLVIAELGAAFPNQGGPYLWTRLAFGRHADPTPPRRPASRASVSSSSSSCSPPGRRGRRLHRLPPGQPQAS
jgi:hypothetical protein